ncbi:hypothetical protein FOA52_014445 [Chlamydomonas sp. UWO 241]|nr:hypothetical protein FOA52_014445 [Chlamydomonas sp. UWO 241]
MPPVLIDAYDSLSSSFEKLSPGQKYACIAGGCVLTLGMVNKLSQSVGYKSKPTSFELSGGSIMSSDVQGEFDAYNASYGAMGTGEGIKNREETVHLVDIFYSLVTDFYEWGWGQSFHFSPKLPGKDWKTSEAAHESRIAAMLGVRPGHKVLDVGCGVGGPLRTIASVTGAHCVGLTINQYQVDRAKYHNLKQGVAPLTTVVRGDFLNMPFENASFDGAYAIEATCHAPKLETVYGEVFRVLKPGAKFVTYEWVSTNMYDKTNAEHVRIMDEINWGNGLPEMRTWKEAEDAGKKVGFELVMSLDIATASVVCVRWYNRLWLTLQTIWINKTIVNSLHFLGLLPRGMKEVHDMLVFVAKSLCDGGKNGTFSPMHMLVLQKPAAGKKA